MLTMTLRAVLTLCLLLSLPVQGEENPFLPADDKNNNTFSELSLKAPQDWVQEKTGDYLPLEAQFNDENGQKISLGQLIDRPTLLLPVYYTCPAICSFDQANLAVSLSRIHSSGSKGFRVVSLSFNAEETPENARQTKPNYTHLLADKLDGDHWSFLTGDEKNIRLVTDAIGYRFARQTDGVFLHPSALVAVASDGRIIKYVYGSFIPGDVELALTEAAEGRPSTSIRRLLAFCFPANPQQNAFVFNVLKIASALVLVVGGVWLFRLLRRKNTP